MDDRGLIEFDTIILGTGFLTTELGNSPSFKVHAGGTELGSYWASKRFQAYDGIAVARFPNFFLTAGPFSGGFNWFTMLEAHVQLICQCIKRCEETGSKRVEVTQAAQDSYMAYMWRRAQGTVFQDTGCTGSNSYYQDQHGDASLPLPQTPWWRNWWLWRHGAASDAYNYDGVHAVASSKI